MSLPPLVPLPFLEAIAWAKARSVTLPDTYYGSLQGLARAMAFSVAGLTKLDQVQAVKDSLDAALATGESFGGWKKRVAAGEEPILSLPAHRLDNIFRTNLQGAYNRGRYEQQTAAVASHPWWMYDAVNDSRTRPAHAAMDGKVARYDDPVWKRWYAPNGYRCRCRVIAISDRQAQQFIRADAKRMQDPVFAAARQTAQPDPGWDYNIGDAPMRGIERAIAQKTGPLVDVMREELAHQNTEPLHQFLGPQELDLDVVKDLGAQQLASILDLVTPHDAAKVPAIRDRGQRLGDITDPDALRSLAPWIKEEIRKRLSELRAMGGVQANLYQKSGKAKQIINRVTSKLPDDWVEKGNAHTLHVIMTKVRGYFQVRKWIKAAKEFRRTIVTREGSTAEHEFMHHLQYVDPDLNALFVAEHRRRTANDLLEVLYPHLPKEKGKPDGYVERYQGREYDGDPKEVLTMAFQPVLGDDDNAHDWFAKMLVKDQDMLRLVLGTLFHYKAIP